MDKVVLLDTNIVYNMAKNINCMNEVLAVLKNDKILVSDISIYELTNKAVCLKSIVTNCNIDICRINCWGKGLSDDDIKSIINQIIENKRINSAIYNKMKFNYQYMLHPIVCILLYKYISLIGPLINQNDQMKFAKYLMSRKTIRRIKEYSYDILNATSPKDFKERVSNYIKTIWKKCIYTYTFENEIKLMKFKKALKEQNLSGFLGINTYSKKGTKILDIMEKHYDNYTFPVIEKKYNAEFSENIKFLFMNSIIDGFNVDINSLIDALLISSLSCDVVLCTDDDKMNKFIHSIGRYDEICENIRRIKQKYD